MSGSVLLIDDHARPRRALAAELEEAGYRVAQAEDGDDGWRAFRRRVPRRPRSAVSRCRASWRWPS